MKADQTFAKSSQARASDLLAGLVSGWMGVISSIKANLSSADFAN